MAIRSLVNQRTYCYFAIISITSTEISKTLSALIAGHAVIRLWTPSKYYTVLGIVGIWEFLMRGLIQKLCICGLLVLAMTMPAQSTCVFGLGNTCEPSEADGRKVFEQLMASYLQPPYTIVSFQKTNGIKGQMRGFDVYEMQFAGVLQGDDINCKPGMCIELQRYSVAHNKDNHTFTIRGSLLFRNSERGWSTN